VTELGHPRYLLSAGPWRALWYVAVGAFGALPVLALARLPVELDAPWSCLVKAAAALGADLVLALPLAILERRRLRILVGRDLPARTRYWRSFGYAVAFTAVICLADLVVVVLALSTLVVPLAPLLQFVLDIDSIVNLDGPVPDAVLVPAGLLLLPPIAYLVALLAHGQAALAQRLLGGGLASRVRELWHSRTRLVDAFDAERRRIERDLHDGAQQRLVGLIMTLGLAELDLAGSGAELVAKARAEAEGVLVELRELVRGIHPRVLTDRGLHDAIMELADRCPLPVRVRVTLPRRPSPQVELAAYFVVCEALTNIVKHSRATGAEIAVAPAGRHVLLTVRDDGVGGAGLNRGSGLQGLADRVAVVDGRLAVTSPPGGPTELRVELPWESRDCG
jgi:signal transduction histidine kinase